jgi:hypothetical protein
VLDTYRARGFGVDHTPDGHRVRRPDGSSFVIREHAAPTTNKMSSSPTPSPASPSAPAPKRRVTEPVRGVWDQTEAARFKEPAFQHVSFDDVEHVDYRTGIHTIKTTIFSADGQYLGHVIRSYDPKAKTFVMSEAFLEKVPSKVAPRTGAMLTSDGTPTQTFLTIHQMKRLGVLYGGLKKIKMSTIQNIRSIIQLHVLTNKKGLSLDAAVRQTYSLTYGETTIVQSGHMITDVHVNTSGSETGRLGDLMTHYEGKERDPLERQAKIDEHDKLIDSFKDHNITRDTRLMWDYDIEIAVAPWKGTK